MHSYVCHDSIIRVLQCNASVRDIIHLHVITQVSAMWLRIVGDMPDVLFALTANAFAFAGIEALAARAAELHVVCLHFCMCLYVCACVCMRVGV